MATSAQLESLRKVLTFDHPPLCSGAVSPPPEGFHLWYDKKDPKFVDFASATPQDLDLLAAACDPATFGHGNENVYDESYRKALKMDASNFSVRLALPGSDLIRTIEEKLIFGDENRKRIKAELYKLNIYDEGCFFKEHKDTPRGTDMLGSLVIIFPTAHEGGELVLRHKGREWKIGANALIASRPSPSLAYVAFYSDIDHEILKVTSGRRITITYNLYMVNMAPDPGASTLTPIPLHASDFQTTLRNLIKDPAFLPEGGTLGFGLSHLYPVSTHVELQGIAHFLKGEDARVYEACRELQLKPLLKIIYDDGHGFSYRKNYGIMVDKFVVNPSYDCEHESYQSTLLKETRGVAVNITEGSPINDSYWVSDEDYKGEYIDWVSPFDQRTKLRDVGLDYGNEVSIEVVYCSPCIIVRIDSACDRL